MTRGFSTLEVLIALMVLATTLVAVTLLSLGMPRIVESTRTHREALSSAAGLLSRELARTSGVFSDIREIATTSDGLYQHALNMSMLGDGSGKKLAATTAWQDGFGNQRAVTLDAIVTDYDNAADRACPGLLIGNWEGPSVRTLPGSLPPLSDLAVSSGRLIATASTTRAVGDPILFLFADESAARYKSSLPNIGTSTIGYLSVTASSDTTYAITAQKDCTEGTSCGRFDTISIGEDDLLERTYSIPIPPARSIEYRHGRVYIGLRANTNGPELLLYDVSAGGPPVRVGDAEIGFSVNDIVSDQTYAYIATGDNSSGTAKALMAFDIRSPRFGMTPATTSSQAGAGIAQHLALAGSRLYLGRSSPLNSKEFYIFETGNLKKESAARDTDSSIAGLATRGFLAFVLSKTRLALWNIGQAQEPFKLEYSFQLPSNSFGTAITCGTRSVYVASASAAAGFISVLTGS